MTFKDFIDRYQHINHRLGDLADDIALDDDFPESTDFYENLHYLTGKGVSQACIDTFFDAWAKYRKDPEDQTALYIAMLMEKIEILHHNYLFGIFTHRARHKPHALSLPPRPVSGYVVTGIF